MVSGKVQTLTLTPVSPIEGENIHPNQKAPDSKNPGLYLRPLLLQPDDIHQMPVSEHL